MQKLLSVDFMEALNVISGARKLLYVDPVYFRRQDNPSADLYVPSHLVVWPEGNQEPNEICYVQLSHEKVPVLVTPQQDGSIWIGGAYLDTIAREMKFLFGPLAQKIEFPAVTMGNLEHGPNVFAPRKIS